MLRSLRSTILTALAAIVFAGLAIGSARAQGQPPLCYPGLDNATHVASQAQAGMTKNGAWVRWYCTPRDGSARQVVRYVSTATDLSKWGSRAETIAKAADPLKSLQTAGTRFTILPLSDPSLAAIVADMEAAK